MTDIACTYIDTCSPDYLTDHHNRENEVLLCCCPTTSRYQIINDLFDNARENDRTYHIDDEVIILAIEDEIDSISMNALYPDYYQQSIEEGQDDVDIYIYAYLSW